MFILFNNFNRAPYGIYTAGDENFFAGIVSSINSLRFYGYAGPIAVIDVGFTEWMQNYLASFSNVTVLSMEPVKKNVRYTDELTDENPAMTYCAYKAFGIVHYDIFDKWTFIDADYFPLCNLEAELLPLINDGLFISSEDGINCWDDRHKEATGVIPGQYMNINSGFFSLDMRKYGAVIVEWRDLMTRRKPFDLWYIDQGSLNVILDKWNIKKHTLDKTLWNQTSLNESMAEENLCKLIRTKDNLCIWYKRKNTKIMGWHGMGWYKLWHQIGIDHFRKDNAEERQRFYAECQGKSPASIVEVFEHFLFMDQFNRPLK